MCWPPLLTSALIENSSFIFGTPADYSFLDETCISSIDLAVLDIRVSLLWRSFKSVALAWSIIAEGSVLVWRPV